jgi:hypothetical protein
LYFCDKTFGVVTVDEKKLFGVKKIGSQEVLGHLSEPGHTKNLRKRNMQLKLHVLYASVLNLVDQNSDFNFKSKHALKPYFWPCPDEEI